MAILGAVGFATRSNPSSQPRTSELPAPKGPLTKPEPGQLLAAGKLNLSPAQRQTIAGIAKAWAIEKARLMQAMSGYAPKQGRLDQISTGLQDYSRLSRAYDVARAEAWNQALHGLTESQRKEVIR